MTERKFYRTTIALEILSENPIPEGLEVADIVDEAVHGAYSMRHLPSTVTVLDGKEAAAALTEQASDPSFFRLDSEGNDLDENDDPILDAKA